MCEDEILLRASKHARRHDERPRNRAGKKTHDEQHQEEESEGGEVVCFDENRSAKRVCELDRRRERECTEKPTIA